MSDLPANKQTAKRFLNAVVTGDRPTVEALTAADFTLDTKGTTIVSGRRGRAEMLEALGLLMGVLPGGIQLKFLSQTAEEDRVSCEVEGTSTASSGVAYNNQYHFLVRVRDGKVFYLGEYLDTMLTETVFRPILEGAAAKR